MVNSRFMRLIQMRLDVVLVKLRCCLKPSGMTPFFSSARTMNQYGHGTHCCLRYFSYNFLVLS
jgi:hypothetical protein